MEDVTRAYGRYLLLDAQLPQMEQAKEQTHREALAAEREKSQTQCSWQLLQEPGFFLRLMGKAEQKREEAYRAYQQADIAWKQAAGKAEAAASAYQTAREECESLSAAKEAYDGLEKTEQVQLFVREAFRPAARYCADVCLEELEKALEWTGSMESGQMGGMLEQLAQAREAAGKLQYILSQFPDPESWNCGYLRNPDGFIHGVVMQFSPREQIRAACMQIRTLRDKL